MTLLFSVLFALLLAAFLGATYRQVQKTVMTASVERARAAADELATTLTRSIRAVSEQMARVSAEPAIRALVTQPSQASRAAAAALLAPNEVSGARRVEVWGADGDLLLEVSQSRRDLAPGIQSYPAVGAPDGPAVSPMLAAGETDYFFHLTTTIPSTAGDGTPAGYLRRFGTFTVSAGSQIQRLLGTEARLKVGAPGQGIWTDFGARVEAVPVSPSGVPSTYSDAAGVAWTGASAPIEGTPWLVWVGYPVDTVLLPVKRFFFGIVPVAVSLLLLGMGLVRHLTGRLTRPISALTVATEAVAAGDYSQSVPVTGDDELSRLGRSFNAMTAQLANDVETKRLAESAARKREAEFHALFAANPLPMWVYDLDSLRFLEVNAAAIRLYGYSRDEFMTMRISDIRPQEDVPELLKVVREPRETLSPLRQWRHRVKNGSTIDVEVTSHLLTFEGRRAALVVAQDVTSRTALEQKLRQAQKMEAIGQLAGGVAHDFNNLLTAMLGHSELLNERLPEGDDRREDVIEIQKAGRSASDLTRQLLAFSRQQVLMPQIMDPNDVIRDIQGMLTRVIGEHITLEARLSDGIGLVKVDRSQLEQVLMNLVVNARDAMPGGGRLTIETSYAELDADYAARHPDVEPGPHVLLAVSDSGVGMDCETKAHMFEPFFTTKARGEGTGLGLATIYGIVKQSSGSIEVYSEPGRGSTFKVYLPRAVGEVTAPARVEPPTTLEGTETILLVEDQPSVRAIAARVLRRRGYTVVEAATGQEGLAAVEAAPRGTFALLLTDLVLPDMTGADLAARVDPAARGMRVLYTSGYADESVVRSGIIEAGAPFLQKPYAATVLLRHVREVLDVRD